MENIHICIRLQLLLSYKFRKIKDWLNKSLVYRVQQNLNVQQKIQQIKVQQNKVQQNLEYNNKVQQKCTTKSRT